MKCRSEIAVLFEAQAVAGETIISSLALARVQRLCQRLQDAGPDYADVLGWAKLIARDLPALRHDDAHMVWLGRSLRSAVGQMLQPAPAGPGRADLDG